MYIRPQSLNLKLINVCLKNAYMHFPEKYDLSPRRLSSTLLTLNRTNKYHNHHCYPGRLSLDNKVNYGKTTNTQSHK